MKDKVYFFHQTPEELAKKLISIVELKNGDKVFRTIQRRRKFL